MSSSGGSVLLRGRGKGCSLGQLQLQSSRPEAGTDLHRLHPPLVPLLVVDHGAVLTRRLVSRTVVNHVLQRGQQQKRHFVVRSNKHNGLKNFAPPANPGQHPSSLAPPGCSPLPTPRQPPPELPRHRLQQRSQHGDIFPTGPSQLGSGGS